MDEDHQEVAVAYPVRQTFLTDRAVARQIENVAKDSLADGVIGRVVARGMPDGNVASVEPGHFIGEPVPPLGTQLRFTGGQSNNLVARKNDELRVRCEPSHDGVDGGKILFMRCSRNPGAGITIDDELVTFPARKYRWYRKHRRTLGYLGHWLSSFSACNQKPQCAQPLLAPAPAPAYRAIVPPSNTRRARPRSSKRSTPARQASSPRRCSWAEHRIGGGPRIGEPCRQPRAC